MVKDFYDSLSVQEGNKLVGHWVKEVISYGASSNC